jgi:hypothetical protein
MTPKPPKAPKAPKPPAQPTATAAPESIAPASPPALDTLLNHFSAERRAKVQEAATRHQLTAEQLEALAEKNLTTRRTWRELRSPEAQERAAAHALFIALGGHPTPEEELTLAAILERDATN